MKKYLASHILFLCILVILIVPTLSSNSLIANRKPIIQSISTFTLTYENEQRQYNIDELRKIESYSGTGGHLKVTGDITGPYEYTGVRISTLVNQILGTPDDFDMITISSDGYIFKFTDEQIKGNVMVYDLDGNEIGMGGVTMMLAYEENGEPIEPIYGGPFRIVLVGDDDPVTDAPFWPKYINEIEILHQNNNDNTNPIIDINKPTGGIYLFNNKIIPFSNTIIIGDITVSVDAIDLKSDINKVIFLIDEELKYKKSDEPYNWLWDEYAIGLHTLSVIAYDEAGNYATEEKKVWIFNP